MKKLAYHDFDLVFLINIDAGRLLVVEGGGGCITKVKKIRSDPKSCLPFPPFPPYPIIKNATDRGNTLQRSFL